MHQKTPAVSRIHRAHIAAAMMTCVVTFASSVFSPVSEVTGKEFGVSSETMTLGTSLFVVASATRLPPNRIH